MLERGLNKDDITTDRPRMLSNEYDLDMSFAVECDAGDIPQFWPFMEK